MIGRLCWQTRWLVYAALLIGLAALSGKALATDLPPLMQQWVLEKDPEAQIRFDGMVLFANGERYVPVLPYIKPPSGSARAVAMADPPTRVDAVDPAALGDGPRVYPDLVQFDHGWFLLRLVPTESGRLVLPIRDTYPIALKAGVLPQDLVMPPNLLIPTELRVLLGELPYDPKTTLALPPLDGKSGPPALWRPPADNSPAPSGPVAMLADMSSQAMVALPLTPQAGLAPTSRQTTWKLPLDCLPNQMVASGDGSDLYIGCTTTNELLVVNRASRLVQARLALPHKPGAMALIPPVKTSSGAPKTNAELWIAHPLLAKISRVQLAADGTPASLTIEPLPMPEESGGAGVMVWDETRQCVWVADAFEAMAYGFARTPAGGWYAKVRTRISPDTAAMWLAPPVAPPPPPAAKPLPTKPSAKKGATDKASEPPTVQKEEASAKLTAATGNQPAPRLAVETGSWLNTLWERTPFGHKDDTTPLLPLGWGGSTTTELWTLSRSANYLLMSEVASGHRKVRVRLSNRVIGLAASGNKLYVPSATADVIHVFDRDARMLLPDIELPKGTFPTAIAAAGSGEAARIWVTGAGSGAVIEIDANNDAIVRTMPTPHQPISLIILP